MVALATKPLIFVSQHENEVQCKYEH